MEQEYFEKHARAGLIPWIRDGDELKYLMMISSNPKYGGPRPMISKGKIEENESKLEAAIREAEEELGLIRYNMKGEPDLLADERVTLRSGSYDLTVYGVQIYDRHEFDKWCSETEYTEWHTLNSFKEFGRRDHIKYVQILEEKIKNT